MRKRGYFDIARRRIGNGIARQVIGWLLIIVGTLLSAAGAVAIPGEPDGAGKFAVLFLSLGAGSLIGGWITGLAGKLEARLMDIEDAIRNREMSPQEAIDLTSA